MNPFQRILLGMDLTDMDYHLIHYLQSFSKWYPPQKVYVTHVSPELDIPEFAQALYDKNGPMPMDESIRLELLQELNHRLPNPEFPVDIDVLEGPVTSKLLHWARLKGIDLAILGRKNPAFGSGLSVKRFVRKAHCSVLFLPEHPHVHIRRILVPTDYSEDSKIALKEAIRFARKLPGPPEIVHMYVYEIPSEVHFDMIRTRERFEQIMRKGAMDYHRRYIRDIDCQGITIVPFLVRKENNNPAWYIHEYAEKEDVDLIIMGAKGHSSLSSFLLGSVTERLLEFHTATPILIMRKAIDHSSWQEEMEDKSYLIESI